MFANLNGKYINVNSIRSFYCSKENPYINKENTYITFNDDTKESFDGDLSESILKMSMQIFKAKPEKYFNIYPDYEHLGYYLHEEIEFFALCFDGKIRSVSHSILQSTHELIGYCDKESLEDYPVYQHISNPEFPISKRIPND